ncbi:MAG: amino acid ABC transporter ATP-binding protein [Lachnospiraceae bacterium]|nr:amino acid ABC transporter ATP-binding protein [Lachnospiraceae bacterium]
MDKENRNTKDALLEVKDLTKSFGETQVLKGISFSLKKGEVLAIIGSSGSGKTTLLRCLNFLETADGGQILVGSNPVFDAGDPSLLNPKNIRKNRLTFGLVFQNFQLFPQYSVLQNLTLAAVLSAKQNDPEYKTDKKKVLDEIDARALSLLERIGLAAKKDNFPCQLSGGQQQRVAIARALMLTPTILCFDEPTSALDPELTKEVLRVIRDLKENGHTMVVVTHEMDFARDVADQVIFMANGVIEESGSPADLFSAPKSPLLKSFLSQ